MFGFRKKAKPLVMPEPAWDGEHHLTDIRWNETGSGNGDEHWGYRWVCSCTLMSRLSPTQWYPTEELAAQGHAKHRHAYESAKQHRWGPTDAYYVPPGGHSG